MIGTLRKKFIAVAMGSTFAVLLIIMAVIHLSNYGALLRDADQLLAILADHEGTFPRMQTPQEPREPRKLPQEQPWLLSPETPYETRFFSVFIDEDGVMTESDIGNIAAIQEEEAQEYAKNVLASQKVHGFYGTYRYRVVTESEGSRVIFLDCTRQLHSFRRFLMISLAVSVFGLAVVLILVVLFSRAVFLPVLESYQKQKRFITDASHELKTPLTIIEANTEVLEMVQGENEWTKSIQNQIRRLTTMTQQMVTLTRMDEKSRKEAVTEFDLSAAVAETAELFEAPARAAQKELQMEIAPEVRLRADEAAIRQLVTILLDNAVKYAKDCAQIRICLQKKGRRAQLLVSNPTDQVTQGSQDVLFERFYRTDASRNSGTGGSGIGLSIAKAIVEQHGGKIHAYSRDGASLEITALL